MRFAAVAGPLAAGAAIAGAALVAPGFAAPSPQVLDACRSELPDGLRETAEPGARSGSGEVGEWRVESAQMDGAGSEEAVLIVISPRRGARAWFVAEREGKDPTRKKISLKGARAKDVSVVFPSFTEGTTLAHVDAGEGGQVLLHWQGEKLREVWKVGRTAPDEDHWFVLEDLDGDGVPEVKVFFRRELDIYQDDEVISESGGADDQTLSSGKVDALAVYRWDGGKWKKDGGLLESLR